MQRGALRGTNAQAAVIEPLLGEIARSGEAIVRQGNGVVSVTFARQGRLSRLYAPATVILPFETSQGTEIVLDFSPDELPVCVVK